MGNALITPFAELDIVYFLRLFCVYIWFQFVKYWIPGSIGRFQSFDEVWLSVVKNIFFTVFFFGIDFPVFSSVIRTDSHIRIYFVPLLLAISRNIVILHSLQYVAMYYLHYTIYFSACQLKIAKKQKIYLL